MRTVSLAAESVKQQLKSSTDICMNRLNKANCSGSAESELRISVPESRGGRPGLPSLITELTVSQCGRKATLHLQRSAESELTWLTRLHD